MLYALSVFIFHITLKIRATNKTTKRCKTLSPVLKKKIYEINPRLLGSFKKVYNFVPGNNETQQQKKLK